MRQFNKSFLSLVVALFSCFALAMSQEPAVHGRYLYLLSDFGSLTKLDTVSEREVFSIDLATRTGKLKIPPTSGPGAVDGCLSAQAIYDAASGRFYTVVAEHYKADPGFTNNFRVLAFSVPGIQLVGQWPAGKNVNWETDQPFIDEIRNGIPQLILPNDRAIQNKFDISSLEPERKQIENMILETSGDSVLMYLYKGDDLPIAVAHPKTRRLTLFPTLDDVSDSPNSQKPEPVDVEKDVHLTPGGGYVLVERTNNTLDLFDAKTGKKVKSVLNPKSDRKRFSNICPVGKVIFPDREHFRFVSLGMTFPNVPVVRNNSAVPCGGKFYADR